MVSASKSCIKLTWTPPVDDRGVPIIGYQLEKRKKDTDQWIALNSLNEPIEGLLQQLVVKTQLAAQLHFFLTLWISDVSYAVKDVTEGTEYEFRVSAINESGSGDPSPPSEMVCAKNPNSKWLTLCAVYCYMII